MNPSMFGVTQETLDMFKQMKPQDAAILEKVFNTALGLVWYDLEPTAKLLYPVITPLRNMIPRVAGAGGTATNWKVITGINVGGLSPGVSEGNRTARIVTNAANKSAPYKGLGLEDSVTFEADYAALNFDDVKALAVLGLLRSLMIAEEKVILYGCSDFQINGGNACPTPSATPTTGGALTANSNYYGLCVPLTPEGYFNAGNNGVIQQVVRNNVDGTNDTYNGGCGKPSAQAGANTGAANTAITFSVANNSVLGQLQGAAAYAWFCGNTANNSNNTTLNLVAITTVPMYTFLGNETPYNQTANNLTNANDCSNDTLLFDGLWGPICSNNYSSGSVTGAASGSYFRDLGGNNLTVTTGTPAIVEIDTALKSFWDNYRLSPDIILLNSQEVMNITNKVMSGNGTPLIRFVFDARDGVQSATAGAVIGTYLNKFSMDGGALVKLMLHPNMPPGSIMFYSTKIPYPLSNVTNVVQMKLRRDYYQIEWPPVTRSYQYGIYMDGLLQNYFPPAFGLITGIKNA